MRPLHRPPPSDAPGDTAAPDPTAGPVGLLVGLLLGVLLLLVALRIAGAEVSHVVWVDRDLWRATSGLPGSLAYGAELNYGVGARVPGGAWYALLAVPLALGADPLGAYRFLLGLDALAAGVLGGTVGRWRGALAGALTAAAYLGACEAREALTWLWNPTALPLLIAASVPLLHAAIRTGHPAAYAGWALVLALGAQVHLTAAAWLVLTGLGLALVRPRRTLATAPAWLGAALLAYLPYLLAEAASGWPNTRALTAQGPIRSAAQGRVLTLSVDELAQSAAFLLPRVDGALGAAVGGVVAVAALVTAAAAWRPGPPDPARDTLRVLGLATAVTVAVPALSPSVQVEWRYVLAALPGAAVLAGVGLASLAAGSRRLLGVALPGALVAVAVVAAAPAAELQRLRAADGRHGLDTWEGLLAAADHLHAAHGWTLEDVVGRTSLFRVEEGGLRWREASPFDGLLLRQGVSFPGSQAPPCVAGITNVPRGHRVEAGALAAALGRPADGVQVLEQTPWAPTEVLVRYDPGGRCPTTLANRYLDTPAEAALRPHWDTLTPGEAVEVPSPAGVLRAAVLEASRDGLTSRVLVGVALTPGLDGLRATVHAHQLRGHAYNAGWFQDGLVDGLALRLDPVDGGPAVVVPVAEGPVGLSGVLTPLTADAPLPPGAWRVTLETRVVPVPRDHGPWPLPLDGVDVAAPLGTVQVR